MDNNNSQTLEPVQDTNKNDSDNQLLLSANTIEQESTSQKLMVDDSLRSDNHNYPPVLGTNEPSVNRPENIPSQLVSNYQIEDDNSSTVSTPELQEISHEEVGPVSTPSGPSQGIKIAYSFVATFLFFALGFTGYTVWQNFDNNSQSTNVTASSCSPDPRGYDYVSPCSVPGELMCDISRKELICENGSFVATGNCCFSDQSQTVTTPLNENLQTTNNTVQNQSAIQESAQPTVAATIAPPTSAPNLDISQYACTALNVDIAEPKLGNTVQMSCKVQPQAPFYQFRYRTAESVSFSNIQAVEGNILTYTFTDPGQYLFQCRACLDENYNSCSNWEEI